MPTEGTYGMREGEVPGSRSWVDPRCGRRSARSEADWPIRAKSGGPGRWQHAVARRGQDPGARGRRTWAADGRLTDGAAQAARDRLARRRLGAFADVGFPFLDAFGLVLGTGVVVAVARGGVSLYLEALAVAITASGLIRLAAPSSLRKRCSASRRRSF